MSTAFIPSNAANSLNRRMKPSVHKPTFRARLRGLALAGMMVGGSVSAALLDDMRALVDQGNMQAAFQLGAQNLLDYEGEPEFDFLFGMAAIDSGNASQGVFALERVMLARPDDHRTRLELARGYFILEQYDLARQEFEKVLEVNPPENVRENIQRFMNAIRVRESRYRTAATAYADIYTGYDSNVNSAPGGAAFFSPVLGTGFLAGDAVSQEDMFVEMQAGVKVSHPIAPRVQAFVGGDWVKRENASESAFNVDSYTINGGVTFNEESAQYTITGNLQQYYLGHDRYRDYAGITGDVRWNVSNETQLSAFVSAAQQSYPATPILNSGQWTLGAGFVQVVPFLGNPLVFGTGYLSQETPRRDTQAARASAERDIFGGKLGLLWAFGERTSLTVAGTWQRSEYKGVNTLFNTQREDDLFVGEVTLKYLLTDSLSVSATGSATLNDSNIPINDYDRTLGQVNLRYEY